MRKTLEDCVTIDEEAIKQYIADCYRPEQIYNPKALKRWAKDNGFIKLEENEYKTKYKALKRSIDDNECFFRNDL